LEAKAGLAPLFQARLDGITNLHPWNQHAGCGIAWNKPHSEISGCWFHACLNMSEYIAFEHSAHLGLASFNDIIHFSGCAVMFQVDAKPVYKVCVLN
jgi:hypothetical protein